MKHGRNSSSFRLLCVAALAISLASCGSGGSSNQATSTPTPDESHGVITGISGGYDFPKSPSAIGGETTLNHAGPVGAFDATNQLVSSTQADKDGKFSLWLPSGTFAVSPFHQDYENGQTTYTLCTPTTVTVTVGSTEDVGQVGACVV